MRRDELLAELRRLAVINGVAPDGVVVLAIDDDLDTLQLYRHELEPAGFRVLTADGGELGLRMAREHRPAAILLDLLMPGMDGFAVAAELHQDPNTRDVPIVVLTSHDVTVADKQRLDGTVRQVLQKGPDAADALMAWLRRVVKRADHDGAARDGTEPEGATPGTGRDNPVVATAGTSADAGLRPGQG